MKAKTVDDLTGKDKLAYEQAQKTFEALDWNELAQRCIDLNDTGHKLGRVMNAVREAFKSEEKLSNKDFGLMVIACGCACIAAERYKAEAIKQN